MICKLFKLTVSVLAAVPHFFLCMTIWFTTKCWNVEFPIRWFHLSPKILLSKLCNEWASHTFHQVWNFLLGLLSQQNPESIKKTEEKTRRGTVEWRLWFTVGLLCPFWMDSITTVWWRGSSSTAWPAVHKSAYHLLWRAAVSPHPTDQFCSSFPTRISQSELWKVLVLCYFVK